MLSLTLTLGFKNREEKNNLRKEIENRKKIRKELSPLLATLISIIYLSYSIHIVYLWLIYGH